jgi:hypothetical protein
MGTSWRTNLKELAMRSGLQAIVCAGCSDEAIVRLGSGEKLTLWIRIHRIRAAQCVRFRCVP